VFDGSIINPGVNGYPTLFYTSTTFGPLGAVTNETEGVETQSIGERGFIHVQVENAGIRSADAYVHDRLAWTEDDGVTWIKANFGQSGNPVIYQWPEQNLSQPLCHPDSTRGRSSLNSAFVCSEQPDSETLTSFVATISANSSATRSILATILPTRSRDNGSALSRAVKLGSGLISGYTSRGKREASWSGIGLGGSSRLTG
jgi:hypothetical protein